MEGLSLSCRALHLQEKQQGENPQIIGGYEAKIPSAANFPQKFIESVREIFQFTIIGSIAIYRIKSSRIYRI